MPRRRQELPPVDGGGLGLFHHDGSGGWTLGGALQLHEQVLGQVSHQAHPSQSQVHQVIVCVVVVVVSLPEWELHIRPSLTLELIFSVFTQRYIQSRLS